MKLYFVRHGVTQEHESKKSQSPHSLLSKVGEKQAGLLARRLKKQNLKFDVVFASPFGGTFGGCFIANCLLGSAFEKETFMKVFHAIKMDNTGFTMLE